jgi:hypothetical protein
MALVGYEPTISAGERMQTYALDSAATETGNFCNKNKYSQFAFTAVSPLHVDNQW